MSNKKMNRIMKQSGFSLSEVLIAIAILMVGMLLVAGTFPVGIHLTAISTERTIGVAVADEAFAKIRLYDIDLSMLEDYSFADGTNVNDFNEVALQPVDESEYLYPSVNNDPNVNQVYNWYTLFRKSNATDLSQVQVVVFVSRKVAPGLKYKSNSGPDVDNPMAIYMKQTSSTGKMIKTDKSPITDYLTTDSVVVADRDGQVYRVIDIDGDKVWLDKDWQASSGDWFWVVPPPVGGGRSPCVGVYQRTMNF